MQRGRLYGCPVELALTLLGGKWKTIILARLKQRPMQYGEIRRAVPGIADKVLTQRLAELVEAGFLTRPHPGRPYDLTEYGRSLAPALQALYDWGEASANRTGARFRQCPPAA